MPLPPTLIALTALLLADEPRRAPEYPDHTRLLVIRDAQGAERPIESASDWDVRRSHILSHFQAVTGPLPGGERRVPLDLQVVEEIVEPHYIRRKVTFAVEPGDRVPAWLLIPRDDQIKHPAVLCLHQTIPMGKDEVIGLGDRPNRDFARELAARGYVVLAPDYPNFGEYRVDPYALGYASATMKGIWNHMRGVDLLVSLPEVDPDRIAALGHSLGGHNAIFVALFDERIRAVVSSCGFNSFPHYYGGNIKGWSHRGYMPRLQTEYELDPARVPFDFPELIGALAPRAFFTNSPTGDENFAVEGVRTCIRSASEVYRLVGVPDRLVAEYPDDGHDFPPATREAAYHFLDREIGPAPDAGPAPDR